MDVLSYFKLFAVFASRTGVLKNFTRNSSLPDGYSELKTWAQALPETGRIAGINDFIFGQDLNQIGERLRSCKGYFLFVEYGAQQTQPPDREYKRLTETQLSCIIGFMPDAKNWDLATETIINTTTESMVYQLANLIASDDRDRCSYNRLMEGPITIMPVEPSLSFGAVGWQMAIKVKSFKIE